MSLIGGVVGGVGGIIAIMIIMIIMAAALLRIRKRML